jgi:hypothetical protein
MTKFILLKRVLFSSCSLILKQYKHEFTIRNVIPGNHGKTFGTNAMEENDLTAIKIAC